MKRKKTLKKLRKALILLNEEEKQAPPESKEYYRGVETGMAMAINILQKKYIPSIFEKATESVEELAKLILKKPCTNMENRDCVETIDCLECMKSYLMTREEQH
ncbi:MAG: hypothetical protein PHX08_17465 [Lachnospiraceae bacterium]|nr:hypothetical protein [Lachnospiraceae bacterium]